MSDDDDDEDVVSVSDALEELDDKPICLYCKGILDKGKIPSTCLLNDMYRGKCPPELLCLNYVEMMMCRLVKCFQTIIRPGAISSKMPRIDRLQAVKGRFIHLPLAAGDTLAHVAGENPGREMFDQVGSYIAVYGLPTKTKKVFRELVDRSKVFAAMKKLKEINQFYADVPLPVREEDFLPDVFESEDEEDDEKDRDDSGCMNNISETDNVSKWQCKHCQVSLHEKVGDLLKHEGNCSKNLGSRNADSDSSSDNDSDIGNDVGDEMEIDSCNSSNDSYSDALSQTLSVLSIEHIVESEDDAASEISMVCNILRLL